jgi:hypothetical protein
MLSFNSPLITILTLLILFPSKPCSGKVRKHCFMFRVFCYWYLELINMSMFNKEHTILTIWTIHFRICILKQNRLTIIGRIFRCDGLLGKWYQMHLLSMLVSTEQSTRRYIPEHPRHLHSCEDLKCFFFFFFLISYCQGDELKLQ